MEALKDLIIKEITVISKYPYEAGRLYADYQNGRGCHGIVVIVSGEMEFEFADGHTRVLCAGEVALFSEKAAYKVRNLSDKDAMHYSINFCSVNENILDDVIYFKPEDFLKVIDSCDQITDSWRAGNATSRLQSLSVLYSLIAKLFEEKLSIDVGVNNYKRLTSLKKYIDENYGEKLDLNILASRCLMSKTNFRRLFNKIFSVSPIEYLIRLRLSHAAELISVTTCDISDIALRCGFSRSSYFCDLFKERTGYSPSDLRKRYVLLEDVLKKIN